MSGLFYLLGHPHPSQDLQSRPCLSQDLPHFPSKVRFLVGGDPTHDLSLGHFPFYFFSFFFLLFGPFGLHGPS